jgi:UDP-glucose 4-epimerase
MKILISGGTGFIGSHIVDLYLREGHEVVVVDDLSSGSITNLNPKAIFYKLDIRSRDLAQILRIEKPDVVNHHAAQTNREDSDQNRRLFAEANIIGSTNLINLAVIHQVKRIIFASPGLFLYGTPEYSPMDEEHSISPTCQYAAGKRAVEQLLQKKHEQSGLHYTIFRYANVYGPRQNTHGVHGRIATYIADMIAGNRVYIKGECELQQDYLYVEDCAYANLLALDAQKNGIYNLGSGTGCTLYTILTILKTLTGYDFMPIHDESESSKAYKMILDNGKIAQDFGWKPGVDIFEGLQRSVQYYKEYCEVL